jgi:NTP pyrophosphatase (non-canonical NTP hydrolase)
MNFKDYQEQAYKTAAYQTKVFYPALGLAGEAGEVANQIKKIERDDGGTPSGERKRAVAHEIGDLLWYVAALCTDLDLDMDVIAEENLQMLASRQARGTIHGDGDYR